jgi:hypothetical protein
VALAVAGHGKAGFQTEIGDGGTGREGTGFISRLRRRAGAASQQHSKQSERQEADEPG